MGSAPAVTQKKTPQAQNPKRVGSKPSRRERACKRTGDLRVTRFGEGAAVRQRRRDFQNKSRQAIRTCRDVVPKVGLEADAAFFFCRWAVGCRYVISQTLPEVVVWRFVGSALTNAKKIKDCPCGQSLIFLVQLSNPNLNRFSVLPKLLVLQRK